MRDDEGCGVGEDGALEDFPRVDLRAGECAYPDDGRASRLATAVEEERRDMFAIRVADSLKKKSAASCGSLAVTAG